MSGYIKREQLHEEVNEILNNIHEKQDVSEKGQSNGYAGLDNTAKIPASQLPDSILGQVEYISTWNATTNMPTLPNASTAKGHYYVVDTGGTYNSIDFKVGDWAISNGVEWQKVDNTDAVPTVFGRIGNIVASSGDYAAEQISLNSTNFSSNNVKGGMDELFTNVSNGKTAVAAAITGKGVAATGSDTFTQLSTKIGSISTGTGNAVPSNVLFGRTFTNSSGTQTGTMPNNGEIGPDVYPTNTDTNFGEGYYEGLSFKAVTFDPATVLSGVVIADTTGTMPYRGDRTFIPSAVHQTIDGGYYNGNGLVIGDSSFVASNIKAGTSIFGVVGSYGIEPVAGSTGILQGIRSSGNTNNVRWDFNVPQWKAGSRMIAFDVALAGGGQRFELGNGNYIDNFGYGLHVNGTGLLMTPKFGNGTQFQIEIVSTNLATGYGDIFGYIRIVQTSGGDVNLAFLNSNNLSFNFRRTSLSS